MALTKHIDDASRKRVKKVDDKKDDSKKDDSKKDGKGAK